MRKEISEKRLMPMNESDERHYFGLAFELAYFIHVNKEIAFFVAEDALDSLASALSQQEKNRKPFERLNGFLKWGERSRPVRKTIRLNEQQMLQWLVYKQSESWERESERGEGAYLPTEEDMIVRYVEHLVFLTIRYGSFYVTLAVGSLLHQFNRRATRMFYDILTQNDLARMKDTNYIGKQRLEVLEKVSRRFGHMLETVKKPGDERQFLMRPSARWVNDLVRESLRRFTPLGTDCVVKPGFDVTDIPELYFSEAGNGDEESIEIERIHTVLDPVCFARFADGLSRYIQTLPDEDQDKGCNYDFLDERLKVPRFSNFPSGTSRGNRLQPPELTREDYIRLERTLEARAHRKRNFIPQRICIYIDDVLSYSFDPKKTSRARYLIRAEAGVVEVRGRDDAGELTLVTILRGYDLTVGEGDERAVARLGNMKVTVHLTPLRDADGAGEVAQLEVSCASSHIISRASGLTRQVWFGLTGLKVDGGQVSEGLRQGRAGTIKAVLAVALMMATATLIWWQSQLGPVQREVNLPEQTVQQQVEERESRESPVAVPSPSPTPKQMPPLKEAATVAARAAWSTEREAALLAVLVEPTRAPSKVMLTSRREAKVVLSLPLYDDEGREYSRYRVTLSAGKSRLWQQTLRAPKVSLTGYAHILELSLFTQRWPRAADSYELEVEGRTERGWRPVGQITLAPQER